MAVTRAALLGQLTQRHSVQAIRIEQRHAFGDDPLPVQGHV
jgi:hypothetical protein